MALGAYPTPVERLHDLAGVRGELWIKRDDLNAPAFGGNKVRALEFLLGAVRAGDTVLTVGGEGSTHVLTTAAHARRLGLATDAVRWPHDMSPTAHAVAERAAELCARIVTSRGAVRGLARAATLRLTASRDTPSLYIPLGGSTPLGILGHVNAALELAEQVARGEMPVPTRVVVPLGSGGTAAGLALGFRIAGLGTTVVGARVGPRVGANGWRALRLARATAALIARHTGEEVTAPDGRHLLVVHDVYGGAYGRSTPGGEEAAEVLRRARGIRLDATYSAKAFAAARTLARVPGSRILFWLTFDGRWMG
ncbi:MAG: pyridoxal-phosphate dependent enzyme [Gemmatimonadaceae bacterium]